MLSHQQHRGLTVRLVEFLCRGIKGLSSFYYYILYGAAVFLMHVATQPAPATLSYQVDFGAPQIVQQVISMISGSLALVFVRHSATYCLVCVPNAKKSRELPRCRMDEHANNAHTNNTNNDVLTFGILASAGSRE